ncbi:cupin domain-containing protein [Vibrio harveyi]|uniref:cupin domain-containing protein n=1 Tax=Vibrio harveyi TaxID=669 RepID=UPI000576A163|nr:cupin domain-containing protein [Vibrio harveyi]MBY7699338.1 cupin domain-containing protein [Vibrio harveyi]PNM62568.1 cupin domain-containing protein [Vibrio harveyi]UIL56473.1 cupin domain-containing protein [Vibrio harveyi]SQA36252.1 cupin [Vibrio harveyi]
MKKLSISFFLAIFSISCSAAVTSENLIDSSNSWNGTKLPSLDIKDTKVTIKKITIDAGEKLPIHLHPVVNAGVLLSGKLTVYSQDQSHVLHLDADTKNNAIIEMVNQYHYGVNESNEPAEIIVFYVSDKSQGLTKLKPKEGN